MLTGYVRPRVAEASRGGCIKKLASVALVTSQLQAFLVTDISSLSDTHHLPIARAEEAATQAKLVSGLADLHHHLYSFNGRGLIGPE